MEPSSHQGTSFDASISFASSIENMDTIAQENSTLRVSTDLIPSKNKDVFGEDIPSHGSSWLATCTTDPSIEALQAAERSAASRITFGTRYTASYFTTEGVPIAGPIEEPPPLKELMWDSKKISDLADTAPLAGDRAIQLPEPIEMESNTLEQRPRQSAITDSFKIDSEVHQSATKDQLTDEHMTTMPAKHHGKPATDGSFGSRISNTVRQVAAMGLQIVHDLDEKAATRAQFLSFDEPNLQRADPIPMTPIIKSQDKASKDGSFRNRVSDTMRNVAAKGLQIVHDLDEKAATRAQFSFDDPFHRPLERYITTAPVIKRQDKSSTDSSLGSRVSSTMRNLADLGSRVIAELDEKAALHARFDLDSPIPMEQPRDRDKVDTNQKNPFEKWLHTIKRRGGHRKTASCDIPGKGTESSVFETLTPTETRPGHRKSLSGSSFGFVSNMKSVGTSLASFSIAPRSRTGMSSRHQRTDLSSKASYAGRASEDNARGIIMDREVAKRMEQRQGVIEEIISTEKNYLDDIQALIRVFDGFLITVPILSQSVRKSIVLTLKDIWTHNNQLYNELVAVVTNTNKFAGVGSINLPTHPPVRGHKRWQSLGGAPASESTESQDRHIGDPKVAGEIAKIFCGKIPGLILYESYGIMHKEVMKQIHTSYRTTDEWKDLNQAIRSTEELIASMNERESGSRKGRDFEDYFIKPIQRIARYEVLFGRLLQQSPVCDCPESSTDVETTLFRIKELHKAMNCTTGNNQKATAMSRTWLLQDRLAFTSQPESSSRDRIRTLGQNHLCGVLHACWQMTDSGRTITGQYLIALLYEKFIVLAQIHRKHEDVYCIQACIPIGELSVEEVDNGKGLQCHTAPHSWKIVFEHNSQLFEIIMSACSAKEELEWRSRLVDRSGKEGDTTTQQEMIASLSLDIKPIVTVYGKPRGIARSASIHRAATITGQSTIPRSVIIRGTGAAADSTYSSSASQISMMRSQSLAGPHRPIILAPPRADRVHLENVLVEVWTRDIIPYPGMGLKPHKEHAVRASASSMMRKLSHASISSITKRSSSMASLHRSGEDHTATELDSLRPMPLNLTRKARHNSSESMPLPDLERSLSQEKNGRHGSRLAVIIDEKESSLGTIGAHSTSSSPIMARLTSFRSKKSVGSLADMSRRSTPSTSPSAKSTLALPIVTAANGEELRKENVGNSANVIDASGGGSSGGEEAAGDLLQAQQKKGKNRAMLMEGLKNLFR